MPPMHTSTILALELAPFVIGVRHLWTIETTYSCSHSALIWQQPITKVTAASGGPRLLCNCTLKRSKKVSKFYSDSRPHREANATQITRFWVDPAEIEPFSFIGTLYYFVRARPRWRGPTCLESEVWMLFIIVERAPWVSLSLARAVE